MDPTQSGYQDTAMAPGEQALRWIQWLMQHGGAAAQTAAPQLADAQQNAPDVMDPMGIRTGAWNMLKAGADPMGARTAVGNATGVAPAASAVASPPAAQAAAPDPSAGPPPDQGGPGAAQDNGTPMADQGRDDSNKGQSADKGPNQPPTGGPPAAGGAPAQAADPAASGPQAGASQPAGAGGAYPGTPPQARNEQRFGYDPASDSPGSWASRVFSEGMKDAGTNLYDPLMAQSPWGRFLSERYTPDLESRLMLGEMNGGVGAGNEAGFAQQTMRDLSAGGGAAAGGSPFDALKGAASNLTSFANGGSFNDPSQTAALGRMANDPIAQSNAILGGMRGATGGFGAQYAQSMLGDMQRQYANDPSQYQPSGFMAAALAKLGIR